MDGGGDQGLAVPKAIQESSARPRHASGGVGLFRCRVMRSEKRTCAGLRSTEGTLVNVPRGGGP